MTVKQIVDDFVGQRKLALVGMSSKQKKFGNTIFKELKSKGYQIFPVHPSADTIDGARCWPRLDALPEPVGGVIVVVPPAQTEKVVRDVVAAGIKRVWMQQGAESKEAVAYCEENGVAVVHGRCILMFAEPVTSIHKFHRWLLKIFGKLPR